MFESLGDRLQNALHKIKGYGKITEDNISEMMREIRLALLEADVNYKVVKEFTNTVKEKALGEEVKKSLTPGEMFVGIIRDELEELWNGYDSAREIYAQDLSYYLDNKEEINGINSLSSFKSPTKLFVAISELLPQSP